MKTLLAQMDERQLKLICGCALFLLFAAVVMYGFWPKVQELRSLYDNQAVLAQVTTTQSGASGEIERLNSSIEALRKQLQGDMASLPLREMESFILGRLQTISWRNNITLVGVEPSMGESVEMYREVLFKVELSGDYFSLIEWLDNVSSELGFVVIKEFQLGVGKADPLNPEISTRLLLAAYRVKDN
jgi:Tfp pilus assembly protein PilO